MLNLSRTVPGGPEYARNAADESRSRCRTWHQAGSSLIADPDECLLKEYRDHLQDGFKFVTAQDGLECIARLREGAQDVLVLEPQLPSGGGDGVLTAMQALPELASVPVMILTSCRTFAF